MTKIRIGFLTGVLTMAISLTTANNLYEIKMTSPYDCRENEDYVCLDGDFKKCTGSIIISTKRRNDDYSVPINANPETTCPGEGLYAVKSLNPRCLAPEDFECTSGTEEFCCARVVSNTLSGTCESITYPISVQVFCKTVD